MNDIKEIANPSLKVPLARPWFDDNEPAAAEAVVASKWLIFGPRVKEFEERFAAMHDAKHGIAVNSGSSALLVGMWALGVGPGDEVIAPDMTFVSTATSAIFLGAKPVLCDIEPRHHNLCVKDLAKRITPKTKCIVPVHYAGHSADMKEILELADAHGIPVLEDAAEAHLARYDGTPVGAIGKAGIFSFTPSKPMTTGEGGMILTNDDEVAEKCRLFRNFGDSDKFQWDSLGFNFRMPEVMGAIGLHQLDKLEAAVAERHAIAGRYSAAFGDHPAITVPNPRTPADINYQLYTLLLDIDKLTVSRDDVIAAMQAAGVSTRLYYPPMHRAKVFDPYDVGGDADFPETVRYSERAVSLPIYPGLTGEQQDAVIAALLTTLNSALR